MKHIIFILLVLLSSPMLAQTKISTYDFNGHTYTLVKLADGTKVEVKGESGMEDADAFIKADAIVTAARQPIPELRTPLTEYTDEELLAEVTRRGLAAEGAKTTEVATK